jgi:cell division protein FtsL
MSCEAVVHLLQSTFLNKTFYSTMAVLGLLAVHILVCTVLSPTSSTVYTVQTPVVRLESEIQKSVQQILTDL